MRGHDNAGVDPEVARQITEAVTASFDNDPTVIEASQNFNVLPPKAIMQKEEELIEDLVRWKIDKESH